MSKKIKLWDLLVNLTDNRDRYGKIYSLASIISLMLTGYICGCNSTISVARFGRNLSPFRRKKLGFHKTMPCHATLGNVLKSVDMNEVENVFGTFVIGVLGIKEGHVAHMDGKRLRGSKLIGKEPGTHLLSLFSKELSGVINQVKMKSGENEIGAANDLLQKTSLKGLTITGDAIFTQKEICKKIVEGGGNYFFAVKDNQLKLKEEIKSCFLEDFSPLGEKELPFSSNLCGYSI